MPFGFKGGIHPEYKKEYTSSKDIEELPSPDIAIIPLLQHIGTPCKPIVSVGDSVAVGQIIGDSDAGMSCPVHASISGKVIAVEPRWHPSGVKVESVVIENDGLDIHKPCIMPYYGNIQRITPEEIIDYARKAGIVGMGGAAFPLHVKLKSAIDAGVHTIIVNGAECEPFITSDHRAMLEYPRTIAGGVELIMRCLGIESSVIAIEKNKPDAIASMTSACADKNIEIIPLPTKYPQGGEKQLVRAITGREIPPGKLPMDVGCIVLNVDSCASLYRAIIKGVPLTKRVVTVSGPAVNTPKNLLVHIGTPFEKLFEYCDGFAEIPYKIIHGGPMMGSAQHNIETPIVKNSSALLAFCNDENETFPETQTCIRCGKCLEVCPMNLMPSMIYKSALKGEFLKCKEMFVQDCIECGCCSYICPGKLYLVQAIRMAKCNLPKNANH